MGGVSALARARAPPGSGVGGPPRTRPSRPAVLIPRCHTERLCEARCGGGNGALSATPQGGPGRWGCGQACGLLLTSSMRWRARYETPRDENTSVLWRLIQRGDWAARGLSMTSVDVWAAPSSAASSAAAALPLDLARARFFCSSFRTTRGCVYVCVCVGHASARQYSEALCGQAARQASVLGASLLFQRAPARARCPLLSRRPRVPLEAAAPGARRTTASGVRYNSRVCSRPRRRPRPRPRPRRRCRRHWPAPVLAPWPSSATSFSL